MIIAFLMNDGSSFMHDSADAALRAGLFCIFLGVLWRMLERKRREGKRSSQYGLSLLFGSGIVLVIAAIIVLVAVPVGPLE